MRRSSIIQALCLAACLLTGVSAGAESSGTNYKWDKLQEQIRTLERELIVLKEVSASKLDAQDKRVGDIALTTAQQANHMAAVSNQTTSVGNYIALTSIGITMIVFAAGFITYISTKNRAVKEARDASEKWFQENSTELKRQIATLEQKAAAAGNEIDGHAKRVADDARAFEEMSEAARKVLQTPSAIEDGRQPGRDEQAVQLIQQASNELKSKPEASFTASEHYTRGISHYANGDYQAAQLAFESALDLLGPDDPDVKISIYLFATGLALGAQGKSDEAISVYDEIDRRFGSDPSPTQRELVAKALLNKGVALRTLGNSESAVTVYNEIDRRYGTDPDPALREQVAKGLQNKGIRLVNLEKYDEAVATYDEIYRRYGADLALSLREQVAKGRLGKAMTLYKLGRSEEAIALYDEIDRGYGADPAAELRELVAKGLLNKGVTLGTLGKSEDAISVYNEIDRRYGADPAPVLREQVAKALLNKSFRLRALNRLEEALSVCDEIDGRFGKDPSPTRRQQVAKALYNKGSLIASLERPEEAIAAYDEMDRRFGSDPTPTLREQVASALNSAGYWRIVLAKKNWARTAERTVLLSLAIANLNRALSNCTDENRAMIYGNLGYALFLSGDPDGALSATRECLVLGGQKILDGQRVDAQLHRLEPEDSEYELLLSRFWNDLQSAPNNQETTDSSAA